jgi:WD40 repeat protein
MMRTIIVAVIGLLVLGMVCGAAVAPADLTKTIDAHYAAVSSLGITPDGTALFSAGKDGKVRLWDTTTLEMLLDVPACQVAINDLAVSPDGTFVVTAGEDGYVKVWDALTADLLVAIPAHKGAAMNVTISPDSLFIFSGGDDGFIRCWSIDENYGKTFEVYAHTNGVTDMILNAAGTYLFSCGVDGYVKVMNAQLGTVENSFVAFERGNPVCLRLNHLEACLAVGATSGEIRIFDAATNSLVKTLRAHAGTVTQVAFIDDDSLLVSCGEDGKVKLWNHQGELAGELQAHVLGVRDFLLVNDRLITGGADYKVRVWNKKF